MTIDSSTLNEGAPHVAMDLNDGDFVVTYTQGNGFLPNVIVKEMSGTGAVKSTINLGQALDVAVSINDSDQYFLAYTVFNGTADPGLGIFGQRGGLV